MVVLLLLYLLAVVDDMRSKFVHTLCGYFLGQRLAFPIVEDYVKHAWAKFGFECVMMRNDFFLFKFKTQEGMTKVLECGPWFIKSNPMFLKTWVPNTRLEREKITKVPVWVTIHNVPAIAYSEVGIGLIAQQLGRLIRMDAGTRAMCTNPWGRYSYARVLMELSAERAVLESIDVSIPLYTGMGHYMEVLEVEYDWWPSRCSKCTVFNHDDDSCPLRRNQAARGSDSAYKDIGDNRGVYMEKVGNKVDYANQRPRSFKPKSKFEYKPVSQPHTKKNTKGPKRNSEAGPLDQTSNDDSFGTSSGVLKGDAGPSKVAVEVPHVSGKTDAVGDVSNSVVPAVSGNESLLEQFYKTHNVSKRKESSSLSLVGSSDDDEVFMPEVIPGAGFLDDLKSYDGYDFDFPAHGFDTRPKGRHR